MSVDRMAARRLALLALHDCAVIRVRLGAVPLGYRMLQAEEAVTVRRDGDTHAAVRLNDRGAAMAGTVALTR